MKLAILISVCAGLMLSGAAQADEIRLNQRFSGVSHETGVDLNGDGLNGSTFSFQVKGNLGKATIQSQGEFEPIAPNPGCDFQSALVYQNFVQTFADGSMLFFMTTFGENCVIFVPFEITIELSGIITGGTGRFEGATGSWTVEAEGFPVGPTMSATTGTLKGTFSVPRGWDDDDHDSDSD